MAVLLKALALATAATTSLFLGANGAAINGGQAQSKLECFTKPQAGWSGWYDTATIDSDRTKFCGSTAYGIWQGTFVKQFETFSETYDLPSRTVIISVSNIKCGGDGMWVGQSACTTALGQIEDYCWIGDDGQTNNGGTYNTDCGNWVMQAFPADSKRDTTDDPNLACFPSTTAGSSDKDGIQDSVKSFCNSKKYGKGQTLPESQSVANSYDLDFGSVRISANNYRCPNGMEVDEDSCLSALNEITGHCWIGAAGDTNVFGSYAVDCGHYLMQFSTEDSKRDVAADSTNLEKRCEQTCYDSTTSGCHPLNWESCTADEKSCLVGAASSAQGCLMSGNCAPVCSSALLDKRCDQYCYDSSTSGCHPPNWDSCTAAEKSCLVNAASDAQGCLMVGNCAPICSSAALEKRCDQTCYDSATSGCHPPNWDSCDAAEKSCLVGAAASAQGCLMAGNCAPFC